MPAFAVWTIGSPLAAVGLAAAATAMLLPIAYLSFMTLARAQAKYLTLLFGACNLALLLPLRSPGGIALAAAIQAGALILHELQRVPGQTAMRTPEGRFCRLLLTVPLAIMVGRCLMYEPSLAVGGVLILAVALAVHRLAARWSSKQEIQLYLRTGAALAGCLGWLAIVASMFDRWAFPESWILMFFALPCSALLLGAAAVGEGETKALRFLALAVTAVGAAFNLALLPNVGTALVAVGVGIAVLAYGYWVGSGPLIGLAAVLGGFGVWIEMKLAVEIFGIGRWGALALLGIVTILASAVLERYGEQLRTALPRLVGKLGK